MRTGTDLYAILGLTRDATPGQISRAYRTLLHRYHPDTRGPGDPARDAAFDKALQQILTAYAVLHDPDRRAEYDRHHTAPAVTLTPARPIFTSRTSPGNGYFIHAGPAYWSPWPIRPRQRP